MHVKILVCYHKPSPIIANACLQPILVGAAQAKQEIIESLESSCIKAGTRLLKDNTPSYIYTNEDNITGGGQTCH